MNQGKQWYAVYTKPGGEKKTAELLSKKKIESYYPLNKVVRIWKERIIVVYKPLFSSYVFIHASESDHLRIKETVGVLNFIYWLGKPAVINEAEIETIKAFLKEHQNVQLEQMAVNQGGDDTIKHEAFQVCECSLPEVKKSVKTNLPTLGYALVAAYEKTGVEILAKADITSKNIASVFGYRNAV